MLHMPSIHICEIPDLILNDALWSSKFFITIIKYNFYKSQLLLLSGSFQLSVLDTPPWHPVF